MESTKKQCCQCVVLGERGTGECVDQSRVVKFAFDASRAPATLEAARLGGRLLRDNVVEHRTTITSTKQTPKLSHERTDIHTRAHTRARDVPTLRAIAVSTARRVVRAAHRPHRRALKDRARPTCAREKREEKIYFIFRKCFLKKSR